MYCMNCQNDIAFCVCPDKRLCELRDGPYLQVHNARRGKCLTPGMAVIALSHGRPSSPGPASASEA